MVNIHHTLLSLMDLFTKKKKNERGKCFFMYFPDEIKLHIFSFLSATELCVCAQVSREFKTVVMDDCLWKRFFVKLPAIKEAPPARVCHSALVHGERMYIYGGHVPDALNYIRDVKNDFYAYHFATKKWELLNPKNITCDKLPFKTEHTAVLYKNCMYLFGGYSGPLGYRDTAIYEYNFDTRQFTHIEATGNLPPDRSAHTAVVYKDHMYIMGGWDGAESYNDFFKYNFESKAWSRVNYEGTAPPKIRSHSAVLFRDSMVVFGGYGENHHPVNIYMFHFLTSTWEEIRPQNQAPSARSRFRMVFHDDSLWCFGGWDRKTYFNDLWRFRLDTRTWHQVDAEFDLRGVGQHSLVVHKGRMYVYGGYCADSKAPHPGLYVYRLPSRGYALAPSPA